MKYYRTGRLNIVLKVVQYLFSALLQGVNGAIDWAVAISTASAAAGAVTSGASMLQSLAGAPGYNVVCTVEIEN